MGGDFSISVAPHTAVLLPNPNLRDVLDLELDAVPDVAPIGANRLPAFAVARCVLNAGADRNASSASSNVALTICDSVLRVRSAASARVGDGGSRQCRGGLAARYPAPRATAHVCNGTTGTTARRMEIQYKVDKYPPTRPHQTEVSNCDRP